MKAAKIISTPEQGKTHLLSYTEEVRWVLFYALILMLFTTLPYLIGYISQGDDWRFTGFVFGVEDGNSYLAKMRRGSAGDWLFRTPYSAHPQNGVLAFFPYILLGKIPFLTNAHLQIVVLYHVFRIVAGIFSVWATYDFLRLFLEKLHLRRMGLVLSTLGGGLGWFLVLIGKQNWLGSLPIEYFSPESFGFLALLGLPHLSMARALLLWGMCCYLKPGSIHVPRWGRNKPVIIDEKWRGAIAALIWLLMALFQPLTVVVAWIVIGVHLLSLLIGYFWKSRFSNGGSQSLVVFRYFRRGVGSVLLSSPIVIYTLYSFVTDPYLRGWMTQKILSAPHPVHYLLAYGLLIPFAIFGTRKLLFDKPFQGWLPVAWVSILPFLAYIPHGTQRRWVEGVWVALVVLAVYFFERKEKTISLRPALLFLLVLPSTLVIWIGGLMAAGHPAEPLFRKANEVSVFQYIAQISEPGEVVLSSYQTGNALPAWAPVFVVIGHGSESFGFNANSEELKLFAEDFYQVGSSDGFRIDLLRDYRVDFVFWGPHERALGGWDPRNASYLQLIHQREEYAVFSVDKAELFD